MALLIDNSYQMRKHANLTAAVVMNESVAGSMVINWTIVVQSLALIDTKKTANK